MKATVIMDEEAWEAYKKHFSVGKMMHEPMIPPSFPVVVVSHETVRGSLNDHISPVVQHCFIEKAQLLEVLGL